MHRVLLIVSVGAAFLISCGVDPISTSQPELETTVAPTKLFPEDSIPADEISAPTSTLIPHSEGWFCPSSGTRFSTKALCDASCEGGGCFVCPTNCQS